MVVFLFGYNLMDVVLWCYLVSILDEDLIIYSLILGKLFEWDIYFFYF